MFPLLKILAVNEKLLCFIFCLTIFKNVPDIKKLKLTSFVSASKDFECSLCNTTFGRKDNLERHMKNFHQDNPPTSIKGSKASTVNKRKNKENKLNVADNLDKSSTIDKLNAKKKKNPKKKCTVSTCNGTKDDFKEGVVDLSVNKGNIIKCNETILDQMKSTIISPPPIAVQNRPSVIKSVPKLLPYRILPTDKIPLTTSDTSVSNQSLSEPINFLLPIKSATARETKKVQKPKVKKDLAYNKCFRIIHHTSSIHSQQQISNPPFVRTAEANNTNENNSVMSCLPNKSSVEGVSFVSTQSPRKSVEPSVPNFPGGPTLPSTLHENIYTSQEENLSNTSYVPISETSDTTYTPYFESDSFRETVNNNYGDFDIGFQYENETFSYSETSSSGTTRIVKSVETKVIKNL